MALAAFESATETSAPISPTLRLTLELAERLRRQNVLRLLDDLPATHAPGQARALYDPLAWEYEAPPPAPAVLRLVIEVHLQACIERCAATDIVGLWDRLTDSELESYVAHLLRRRNLDPTWVHPIVERTRPDRRDLSLARQRAIAWTSVRDGATALLRTGCDARQCLETILAAFRRGARGPAGREGPGARWLPQNPSRQPLLLTTFLDRFPLKESYWMDRPSAEALARRMP